MVVVWPWFTRLVSFVIEVKAVTLWPFIIVREPMSPVTENHERIHLAQQKELLVLLFYVLYVAEYLFYRAQGASKEEAYFSISFEAEAYRHQGDLGYLNRRPLWAWRHS